MKAIVSEIYSPPRVTQPPKMLPGMGLIPGFALDLTTRDEDGNPWDFNCPRQRQKARKLRAETKPYFLIGSPCCTMYSAFGYINATRQDPEVRRRALLKADVHMRFVMELYEEQVKDGHYFLHEHPAWATSWQLGCVKKILAMDQVDEVIGDQCQYGQSTDQGDPLKKPTRFMSNSGAVLAQLGNRCRGRSGACTRPGGGQHGSCTGNAARKAAIYPFKLCKAILSGVRNQLREDGRFTHGMVGIQPAPQDGLSDEQPERRVNRLWNIDVEDESSEEMGPLERDPEFQALNGNKKLQTQYKLLAAMKIEEQPQEVSKDDLTGQLLDPTMVKAARRVELEYFEERACGSDGRERSV